MTSDLDLLGQYARNHSQDAFSEIVRRHLDLVYSAALRQVHSSQLAEEVAQSVFADLARNAGSFGDGGDASSPKTLTPWLYAVTRRTAIDVIRKESRRQLREQIAVEMNHMNAPQSSAGFQPAWTEIESFLDDAMAALEETDRSAVLLRYFENKTLREVGEALGASEDAAQKRVSRAVERLREFFSKRNVIIGASGLAVLVSANAVHAAPVGLATTISAAAVLAGTAVSTSTAITATKVIAMTTIQKAIIGATLAAAVGAGIFEARQASQLSKQNQALQQQQASLAGQIRRLQQERDNMMDQLSALQAENLQLNSNSNETELLKLRGEVTQLKAAEAQKANNPTEAAAQAWADRVAQLKQRLEQTPNVKIPEFKYLTDDNWLNAAKNPLVADADYRRAFATLRSAGENQFIIQMQTALANYLKQNNGQFPSDVSQLKPFFETAPDDAMLQRYTVVPASFIPNMVMGGDSLITVKNPIDEEYDALWALGPQGFGNTTYQGVNEARVLDPALKAYEAANGGREPKDPSLLLPYFTTPEQQAAYQKLEQLRNGPAK
jgi:RNA polymerase sigma factor (sigma-70 family)